MIGVVPRKTSIWTSLKIGSMRDAIEHTTENSVLVFSEKRKEKWHVIDFKKMEIEASRQIMPNMIYHDYINR